MDASEANKMRHHGQNHASRIGLCIAKRNDSAQSHSIFQSEDNNARILVDTVHSSRVAAAEACGES
jgi:hypothetical protein